MTKSYHVVIAGAGPAGCILARDLAAAGVSVELFESGSRNDLGHNWSDAVERAGLEAAGFALPPAAEKNIGPLAKRAGSRKGIFEEHGYPRMEVWAPDLSCRKIIEFRYITTDRKALARYLVAQALAAGAAIRFNYRVTGLLTGGRGGTLDDFKVTGVTVRGRGSRSDRKVPADIVVDATGLTSLLRTALPSGTGISSPFSDHDLARVFRTVRLRDTKVSDPIVDHYRYAYHNGYQWVQWLNDREYDTGAGVLFDPANPDPREIVKEFIARHPSITNKEVRGGGGICLVGRSPYSLVANGFMAVGDAAGQTIPMTGCGAGGAMAGAVLAARTIIEAARENRSDIAALWSYNRRWFAESGRGANYAALVAMKKILQALDHDDISFLFRRDIMSDAMLTDSINGVFTRAGLATTIKTAVRAISRPALLMKLSRASTAGGAIYRHYMNYPARWDGASFRTWTARADKLFHR